MQKRETPLERRRKIVLQTVDILKINKHATHT